MTDGRLRDLERRWRETRSERDEAAYLLELARAGDAFGLALLETAAFAGSPIARDALGRTPPRPTGFTARASDAIDQALRETNASAGRGFDLHLLVGLLGAPDAFAGQVLATLGDSPERVVADARGALEREERWPSDHALAAPTRLLVLAHDERGSRSSLLTGTEHLLLAMLLLGEGAAAEVLTAHGLVYWDTRETIHELRATVPSEP